MLKTVKIIIFLIFVLLIFNKQIISYGSLYFFSKMIEREVEASNFEINYSKNQIKVNNLKILNPKEFHYSNILEIKDLHTYFYTDTSVVKAVAGLNLSVKRGEVLCLVGESACGKTATAYSIINLIPEPGEIVRGEVFFEGRDLLKASPRQMQKIRGNDIGFVFYRSSLV